MAGYIGSNASVVQIDGYNRTEADAEFVQVAGDTMTGALTGTDLTLSGGVYLGGTGAANKLDDYEEGTYVATVSPNTSGTMTLSTSYDTLAYTKVGRKVTVHGRLRLASVSSPVGQMVNISLPFAIANLTEEAGRAVGTVVVQNAAQDSSNYEGHPTEGVSYTQIGRSNSYASNAAPDFSGDELITLNITYFTT